MKTSLKNKMVAGLLVFVILASIGLIPINNRFTQKAEAAVPGACGKNFAAAGAATGEAAGAIAGAAPAAGSAAATLSSAIVGMPGYPVADQGTRVGQAANFGVITGANTLLIGQLGVSATGVGENAIAHEESCFKKFVLDLLFYLLNNVIIERISADIVTWINSGFKGKPAFVQDPERLYHDIEGTVIGSFLNEFDLGYLCSPFADKLKRSFQITLALQKSGSRNTFRQASQCTLDQVLSSAGTTVEEFSQDFRQGGWQAFLTQVEPQNNQYGAYIIARDELLGRIANAKDRKSEELSWGKGFLSWKKCVEWASPGSADAIDYNADVELDQSYTPEEAKACTKSETVTPGSVAEDQLNRGLGLGPGRIQVADEVNEVVGALLMQLVNKVLGPDGLLGITKSKGGQSYNDQLRTDTQTNSEIQDTLEVKSDFEDSFNQFQESLQATSSSQNDTTIDSALDNQSSNTSDFDNPFN